MHIPHNDDCDPKFSFSVYRKFYLPFEVKHRIEERIFFHLNRWYTSVLEALCGCFLESSTKGDQLSTLDSTASTDSDEPEKEKEDEKTSVSKPSELQRTATLTSGALIFATALHFCHYPSRCLWQVWWVFIAYNTFFQRFCQWFKSHRSTPAIWVDRLGCGWSIHGDVSEFYVCRLLVLKLGRKVLARAWEILYHRPS